MSEYNGITYEQYVATLRDELQRNEQESQEEPEPREEQRLTTRENNEQNIVWQAVEIRDELQYQEEERRREEIERHLEEHIIESTPLTEDLFDLPSDEIPSSWAYTQNNHQEERNRRRERINFLESEIRRLTRNSLNPDITHRQLEIADELIDAYRRELNRLVEQNEEHNEQTRQQEFETRQQEFEEWCISSEIIQQSERHQSTPSVSSLNINDKVYALPNTQAYTDSEESLGIIHLIEGTQITVIWENNYCGIYNLYEVITEQAHIQRLLREITTVEHTSNPVPFLPGQIVKINDDMFIDSTQVIIDDMSSYANIFQWFDMHRQEDKDAKRYKVLNMDGEYATIINIHHKNLTLLDERPTDVYCYYIRNHAPKYIIPEFTTDPYKFTGLDTLILQKNEQIKSIVHWNDELRKEYLENFKKYI